MMNDQGSHNDDRLIEVVTRSFAPAPRTAQQRQRFAAELDRRRRHGWSVNWQPIPVLAAAAAAVLVMWLAVAPSGSAPTQVADADFERGDVLVALALGDGIETAGEELPDDLAALAEVIGY